MIVILDDDGDKDDVVSDEFSETHQQMGVEGGWDVFVVVVVGFFGWVVGGWGGCCL